MSGSVPPQGDGAITSDDGKQAPERASWPKRLRAWLAALRYRSWFGRIPKAEGVAVTFAGRELVLPCGRATLPARIQDVVVLKDRVVVLLDWRELPKRGAPNWNDNIVCCDFSGRLLWIVRNPWRPSEDGNQFLNIQVDEAGQLWGYGWYGVHMNVNARTGGVKPRRAERP